MKQYKKQELNKQVSSLYSFVDSIELISALNKLADHIENGRVLADANPYQFISRVVQKLDDLEDIAKIARIYLTLRHCKHCGTINNSGFMCINKDCPHPEDP